VNVARIRLVACAAVLLFTVTLCGCEPVEELPPPRPLAKSAGPISGDSWQDRLRSGSPKTRLSALRHAGWLTSKKRIEDLLPLLVDACADEDPESSRAAKGALLRLCKRGFQQEVNAALQSALQSTSAEDRIAAARALPALSQVAKAPEGIVPLVGLLGDREESLRAAALDGLQQIAVRGKSNHVATLAAMAGESGNAQTRISAAHLFRRLGMTALESADILLKWLHDEDPRVRASAALALQRFGGRPEGAVKQLVAATEDAQEQVQLAALESLRQIGPQEPFVVERMIELTSDDRPPIRAAAARVLWRLKDAARDAQPRLLALCKDSSPEVRHAAIGALGLVGDGTNVADAALHLLSDDVPKVRAQAMVTVGLQAPPERGVAPAIRMLDDPYGMARRNAVDALIGYRIESKRAWPPLVEMADDSHPEVQRMLAMVPFALGPPTQAEIPAVAVHLTDESAAVRQAAVAALRLAAERGPHKDRALQALRRAADSNDAVAASAARKALASLNQ